MAALDPLQPAPTDATILESGRDAGEALSATIGGNPPVTIDDHVRRYPPRLTLDAGEFSHRLLDFCTHRLRVRGLLVKIQRSVPATLVADGWIAAIAQPTETDGEETQLEREVVDRPGH